MYKGAKYADQSKAIEGSRLSKTGAASLLLVPRAHAMPSIPLCPYPNANGGCICIGKKTLSLVTTNGIFCKGVYCHWGTFHSQRSSMPFRNKRGWSSEPSATLTSAHSKPFTARSLDFFSLQWTIFCDHNVKKPPFFLAPQQRRNLTQSNKHSVLAAAFGSTRWISRSP